MLKTSGKYESNQTAHQLVLNYCDHIVNTLEVLLALMETEMGVLLAKCRAAGYDDLVESEDVGATDEDLLERANRNRQSAEAVARKLLVRMALDGVAVKGSSGSAPEETFKDWDGSGRYGEKGKSQVGIPGLSSFRHSSAPPSVASESDPGGGLRNDEELQLRDVIARLKAAKSEIQSTISTELESLHLDVKPYPVSEKEARTLDLEMAVLVQVLVNSAEENWLCVCIFFWMEVQD